MTLANNAAPQSIQSAGPLSPGQMDFFDREGYLVIPSVFSHADLQPVIDELTREVTKMARELVAKGELSSTFEGLPFERQITEISRQSDKVATAIWNGVLNGPAIFDLICHEKLLDIAEEFCGPEIIASSVYRVRPKIPGHRMSAVPWHQDSSYFEAYCDNSLVLTVWLPLVDATQECGCLWVIPRAHKGEVVPHRVAAGHPYLEIPPEVLPNNSDAVCVPVMKGGILLLTNRTPHASFENSTEITRWSMDLRYQSAALPTNAPITRLPGETTGFHNGPERGEAPIACYPPEADFLVRSILRPNEVVRDAALFHKIRTSHVYRPVSPRRYPATKNV